MSRTPESRDCMLTKDGGTGYRFCVEFPSVGECNVAVRQTGFAWIDGKEHREPVIGQGLKLIELDGHSSLANKLDPTNTLYPDLPIHHIGVVINKTLEDNHGNQGLPFALEISSDRTVAATFSYRGINPLTLTSAYPGIAYELIQRGRIGIYVQNWAQVSPEERLVVWGYVSNPITKNSQNAFLHQSFLLYERSESAKQSPILHFQDSIGVLLFTSRYFVIEDQQDPEPVQSEPTIDIGENQIVTAYNRQPRFSLMAGGRIKTTLPQDELTPRYYDDLPFVCLRFYFLDSLQADQVTRKMPLRF